MPSHGDSHQPIAPQSPSMAARHEAFPPHQMPSDSRADHRSCWHQKRFNGFVIWNAYQAWDWALDGAMDRGLMLWRVNHSWDWELGLTKKGWKGAKQVPESEQTQTMFLNPQKGRRGSDSPKT